MKKLSKVVLLVSLLTILMAGFVYADAISELYAEESNIDAELRAAGVDVDVLENCILTELPGQTFDESWLQIYVNQTLISNILAKACHVGGLSEDDLIIEFVPFDDNSTIGISLLFKYLPNFPMYLDIYLTDDYATIRAKIKDAFEFFGRPATDFEVSHTIKIIILLLHKLGK